MMQKLIYQPFKAPDYPYDITKVEGTPLNNLLADGWIIKQISATNYSDNGVKGLAYPYCCILLEKED